MTRTDEDKSNVLHKEPILSEECEERDDKEDWTTSQSSIVKTPLTSGLMGLPMKSIGLIIACSLGPFFPIEAQRRGLSETETGFILGSFAITTFFSLFIFGLHISKIGAKVLLCYGMLLVGVAQILFGTLYNIKDPKVFRNMCILTRILEGVGNAGATLASTSILSQSFPDNLGLVISTMEVFAGLGGILGPFVGGSLFDLGGYVAPFYGCGGFQLFTLLVCILTVNPIGEFNIKVKLVDYVKLIRLKSILISCFLTATSAATLGIIDTGFSLFLRDYFGEDFSEFKIGLLFLPSSISYVLAGFLIGYLTDQSQKMGRICMIIGGAIQSISCFLIGPIPQLRAIFPEVYPSIASIVVLQILYGCGLASALIPAYNEMVLTAKSNKYAESISLFGLISAVFNASYAFGEGFGPMIGGLLIDMYNFEFSVAIISTASTIVSIMMAFLYSLTSDTEDNIEDEEETESELLS